VGVELGQVLALIPIVFLITQWQGKKSYNAFYKAANYYLILAGIALFIYQMYGYFHGH
jgi:L-lactate permease